MTLQQATLTEPTDMILQSLGKPLQPGRMGVLLARAGVGKTACLTHIALGYLLRDQQVLHVCIDEMPDKIKLWYQELLRNMDRVWKGSKPLAFLQQKVDASRFIMAFLHHTFNPGKLAQSMKNLNEQVGFSPSAIIIDGLDFERLSRSHLEAFAQLAQQYDAAIWMSCRTHRHIDVFNDHGIPYPCHEYDELFDAIIMLEPQPQEIKLVVLKHHDQYAPGNPIITLDPQTFLLKQLASG